MRMKKEKQQMNPQQAVIWTFVDLAPEKKVKRQASPPSKERFTFLLPRLEYDYPASLNRKTFNARLKALSASAEATLEDYIAEVPSFHYVWDGLEVRYDEEFPQRGAGVYATRDLSRGLTFPYYAYIYSSKLFPAKYLDSLLLSRQAVYTLTVAKSEKKGGKEYEFVTLGDPNFSPWINENGILIGLRGLAIGPLINEPLKSPPASVEDSKANCSFQQQRSDITLSWIELTQDVAKDKQLLVCYGDYTREKAHLEAIPTACAQPPPLVIHPQTEVQALGKEIDKVFIRKLRDQ